MNLLSEWAVSIPTGPKGERRPADVVSAAVKVKPVSDPVTAEKARAVEVNQNVDSCRHLSCIT
jgi:hypothetical protein